MSSVDVDVDIDNTNYYSRSDGFDAASEEKQESRTALTNITSKPSVVFSSASSSSSQDDGNGDGGDRDNNGFDDDDDSVVCGYGYYGQEESSSSEAEAPEPMTKATQTFRVVSPLKSSVHSWTVRIAELIVVQILILTLVTVSVQNANRLDLTGATLAKSGDPWQRIPNSNDKNASSFVARNNGKGLADSGEEDCIFVPGGGFSGFWFSLGRLQSIENPYDETFVCYSAGCAGVVATLLHHHQQNHREINDRENLVELYEMARSIQVEWQEGNLHAYKVVETFIDRLLESAPVEDDDNEDSTLFYETIRSNLNILTTGFEQERQQQQQHKTKNTSTKCLLYSGAQTLVPQSIVARAELRRPYDVSILKEMLMQTTWIPLATGSSWTHKGQMDGVFSMFQHPRCRRTVGMTASASMVKTNEDNESEANFSKKAPPSLSWRHWISKNLLLWANTLNMNLSQKNVEDLWRIGKEYGV